VLALLVLAWQNWHVCREHREVQGLGREVRQVHDELVAESTRLREAVAQIERDRTVLRDRAAELGVDVPDEVLFAHTPH
jgi:hypothetical protein